MTTKKPDKSLTRDAINKRLEQLGLTRYQFTHAGLIDASPSTVYRFLNGEVESSSGNLDEMLIALGMRIVNGVPPKWSIKARKDRIDRERERLTPSLAS